MSRPSSWFRAPGLVGVLALWLVSACGGGSGGPAPDAGGREDAGEREDAGPREDGGHPPVRDTVPPTTAVSPSGGLFKAPTTVTLTCSDVGLGCDVTYYTLDGSSPTTRSPRYTAPLRIETRATLRFFSVDRDGNRENERSAQFVVDVHPPTVSSTPRTGTYGHGLTVSLTCDDGDGSGCAAIYFTSDGTTPSTASTPYASPLSIPDTTRLRFIAVDRAGHVSAEGDERFLVDTQPPVTTASPKWGPYAAPIHLTLSCSDTGSGCARIHYTLDGTRPTRSSPVYERPILIESRTQVGFFSVDEAGNEEPTRSLPYIVDTTPPSTVASPSGGTFNVGTTVYLPCDDGLSGSGCDATYASFARDANAPVPPFQLVVSGSTAVVESGVLRFYSVDRVGHAGAVQMVTFIIDREKPSISAAPRGGTYFTPQMVTLTCADTGGTSCSQRYYTLDGSWPTRQSARYTQPLTLSKTSTLLFFAVDGADNDSDIVREEYTFKSDTSAPTTVATPSGGLFRTEQSVTLSCGDGAGIGCASTRYTLDGSEPTETHGLTYTEPLLLSTTTRLRFRSVDALGHWEAPRQEDYEFDREAPLTRAEPVGGAFDGPLAVRLTCQDTGKGCSETRYTVDGSEPSSSSPRYSQPLLVGQTTTVRFASVDPAGNVEATRRETYVLDASTSASSQISIVRDSTPSPTQPRPIDGAFITFVKPDVGTTPLEPEGFFLQAETAGPALFVEVPLASLNPVPVGGERVRVQVNRLIRSTVFRAGIDPASFTVLGTGYPVKALAQDVSGVVLPTSIPQYSSELVTLRGELVGTYTSDGTGSGFSSIRLATVGVPTGSTYDYRLLFRLPELEQSPELTPGCRVAFTTPLWANGAYAQPTLWKWEQLEAVACASPRVVFAQALSATQVEVRFDRRLDASTVDPSGSQFSIPGLTVTGAAPHGTSEVRLQTTSQVPRARYEVTVSDTVKDRLGARVQEPSNTFDFRGFATPARLRISEIDPSREFGAEGRVELEVLQSGPMTNIALWAGGIERPLATLPDVDVALGDIIVVHLSEVALSGSRLPRSEVAQKDELPRSLYPLAHDAAWDVRGTFSFALPRGDRVLRLKDPFGNLQDGVALIHPSSRVSTFITELYALQDEQQWKPASCGGVRCTSVTSPTSDEISVNMRPLFDSGGGGMSLSRIRVEDSDAMLDWAVRTRSLGLPNF
ncbi:chitobiase/beta-hexosaminidase C-terminal domain-containing protein [Myxococcus stipitatus]|uniref:chitobiase/beta-hexosaminidase C-terminal domain-containing protein n=1 Tax=Myxococcus stipitatus TaxID=83455 RepID=UPI0031452F49